MGAIAMDFVAVSAPGSGWTGLTKRVWLLLYAEGGLWTATEVGDKLGRALGATLRDMAESGFVARTRDETPEGPRVRYGVTKACRVPRGVAVEEIEQALTPVRVQ